MDGGLFPGGRLGTWGGARPPLVGRCGTIGWLPIIEAPIEAAPIACCGVIPTCFIPLFTVWAPWYIC